MPDPTRDKCASAQRILQHLLVKTQIGQALKPVRQRKLDEMRGDWNVSIRRACHVFLLDRSTYHYKSRRPGQAAIEQRIKDIC